MSVPPPPDSFGSQPPSGGGQPGGGGVPPQWGPQQGGPPPGYGGYGPPPQGQWPQQPQWQGGPGGPPPKGGKGKWILGGVAVVLAIALAVVVTVLVVRPAGGGGGDGGDPTQPNGGSEFASADDTGPVNIITEDPTCSTWGKIAREYQEKQDAVNFRGRDYTVPADQWNAEQRAMYDTVGDALTDAANQTKNLTTLTPNRVMRELYEQFIAYSSAFVDALPSYGPDDNALGVTSEVILLGAGNACSAVEWGSAEAVAPLVPDPQAPTLVTEPTTDGQPAVFMSSSNTACSQWAPMVTKLTADTNAWRALDRNIPASDWTPEQRAANEAVRPTLTEAADEMQRIGRTSESATFEDFAVMAAQYYRGLAAAIPSYTKVDNFLSETTTNLVRTINFACQAAQ